MRFCFVSTSRGSHFMTELLAALASAAQAVGHVAELTFDAFPPLDGDRVYVVVPHEFDAWGLGPGSPDAAQRERTIALCTENPGTEWFEATYELVAGYGAAVSINRSSAAELRRRGVRCEHLQLGYTARWDSWHRDRSAGRAIDVLYLGAADPRRDPLLAGIGASLWARDCQFLVPPLEPRTEPRPDFLKEDDKYRRLADAKILLNLHRTTSAALEWMRFLEAICNGCVVVSEPSLDGDPLIAGEHYVEAPVERIAAVAAELLDDPPRLAALRERAYDFIRERLPIEPAGERLAELAAELPRPTNAGMTAARASTPDSAAAPERPAAPERSPALERPPALERGAPLGAPASAPRDHPTSAWDGRSDAPGRATRPRPGDLLQGIRARLRGRQAAVGDVLAQTPSYAAADPRVSVLVVLGDDQRASVELLESVASSTYERLEIVALDAEPGGHDGAGASRFLAERPGLPILLLRGGAHGRGAARNLLAERARGDRLLVLPAHGGVFPATLQRLTRALESDPLAFFAYSMVAVLEDGEPVELRGSLPWEPRRLTHRNWIDAPVLLRRERLIELGGYATDPRLHGLEEYDLWCRCAEASGRAVHVPQVLAWHPPRDDSQPRDVAALTPAGRALMRERCPRLFAEPQDT